jgi:hypothetical protein
MGWCSVAYAQAEGTAITDDGTDTYRYKHEKKQFALDYDVRWQVKAVLDYYTEKLGGIGLNLAWNYNTGYPYTPRYKGEWDEAKERYKWYEGEINTARYPDWSKVDLRFTKDLNFFPWSDKLQSAFNVQVFNLFDHFNVQALSAKTGKPTYQAYAGNTGSPQRVTAGLSFKF